MQQDDTPTEMKAELGGSGATLFHHRFLPRNVLTPK
jgi:hypothetical protein